MPDKRTDTEAVEIEVACGALNTGNSAPSAAKKVPIPPQKAGGFSPKAGAPKAPEEKHSAEQYTPESSLLDTVTVSDWNTTYSYYEQFRAAALRLWDYAADACPPVPFFSYIPQYSQMSKDQLAYYLYLRQEICEGRFPEADYSYLLLLLYETINLSDINQPEYSLSVFCNVFRGYRTVHERLGMQVADWMCDYCLIHRCIPPREEVEPLLGELAQNAGFPEFYIGLYSERIQPVTVIRYSSQYDYSKSRYARGENAAIYEMTMNGLLSHLMTDEKLAADFENAMSERYTVTKDAYVGALCAPQIKKRMTVTFRSFSRSHGIRFLVSDILRYADNRLRAHLGYKSRISVGKLPPEIKAAADAYFAEALGLRKSAAEPEVPEYEKLYEPAPSLLTAEAAAEIERASWDTTGKLVEAFGEEVPADESAEMFPEAVRLEALPAAAFPAMPENAGEPPAEDANTLTALLEPCEKEFILAALREDAAAQKRIAAAAGKPTDFLADGINEKATELSGDILLTDEGGYFAVLDDYLEETKKEFDQ